MPTATPDLRELCSITSEKSETATFEEDGCQPIVAVRDTPEILESSRSVAAALADGGAEAQLTLRNVLTPEIRAERIAHDKALLARLTVCPRPNKINFAFGKFLLARKFHDEDT